MFGVQFFSGSISILSPSSRAWAGLPRTVVGQGFIGRAVGAGDGNQFGLHRDRKNARLDVPGRTRNGTAAQRSIDVDVAVGDHFGAVADHAQHHQVATACIHPLPRTQGAVDHHRGCGATRGRVAGWLLGLGLWHCRFRRRWRRWRSRSRGCRGRSLAKQVCDNRGRRFRGLRGRFRDRCGFWLRCRLRRLVAHPGLHVQLFHQPECLGLFQQQSGRTDDADGAHRVPAQQVDQPGQFELVRRAIGRQCGYVDQYRRVGEEVAGVGHTCRQVALDHVQFDGTQDQGQSLDRGALDIERRSGGSVHRQQMQAAVLVRRVSCAGGKPPSSHGVREDAPTGLRGGMPVTHGVAAIGKSKEEVNDQRFRRLVATTQMQSPDCTKRIDATQEPPPTSITATPQVLPGRIIGDAAALSRRETETARNRAETGPSLRQASPASPPQQFTHGLEVVDTVADRLDHQQHRRSQQQAPQPPQPGKDQHADKYRQRMDAAGPSGQPGGSSKVMREYRVASGSVFGSAL